MALAPGIFGSFEMTREDLVVFFLTHRPKVDIEVKEGTGIVGARCYCSCGATTGTPELAAGHLSDALLEEFPVLTQPEKQE